MRNCWMYMTEHPIVTLKSFLEILMPKLVVKSFIVPRLVNIASIKLRMTMGHALLILLYQGTWF